LRSGGIFAVADGGPRSRHGSRKGAMGTGRIPRAQAVHSVLSSQSCSARPIRSRSYRSYRSFNSSIRRSLSLSLEFLLLFFCLLSRALSRNLHFAFAMTCKAAICATKALRIEAPYSIATEIAIGRDFESLLLESVILSPQTQVACDGRNRRGFNFCRQPLAVY
jgi:hypothetical protein